LFAVCGMYASACKNQVRSMAGAGGALSQPNLSCTAALASSILASYEAMKVWARVWNNCRSQARTITQKISLWEGPAAPIGRYPYGHSSGQPRTYASWDPVHGRKGCRSDWDEHWR
jgi:hypothetical protein